MDKSIIIVDDHPLFRTAMQAALGQLQTIASILEAGTIAELEQLLRDHNAPDLILLDLHLPGAHGLSGLLFLRGQYPDVAIAIISATEDTTVIQKAFHHGVRGFIPKSADMSTLHEAIGALLNGESWFPSTFSPHTDSIKLPEMEQKLSTLTPQQFRVLRMISEGMLNKQIAADLNVSEATVKAHVTAIFKKLGVRSRTQAVIAIKGLSLAAPDDQSPAQTDNSPE